MFCDLTHCPQAFQFVCVDLKSSSHGEMCDLDYRKYNLQEELERGAFPSSVSQNSQVIKSITVARKRTIVCIVSNTLRVKRSCFCARRYLSRRLIQWDDAIHIWRQLRNASALAAIPHQKCSLAFYSKPVLTLVGSFKNILSWRFDISYSSR